MLCSGAQALNQIALTRALDWPIAIALLALGAVFRFFGRFSRPHAETALLRPGGLGDLICLDMAARSMSGLSPVYFVEKRSVVWAQTHGLSHVRYDHASLATLWRHAGRYRTVIVTEQRYGAAMAYGWALLARGGTLYSFSSQRLSALADGLAPYSPVAGQEARWFRLLLERAEGCKTTFEAAAAALPPTQRKAPSDGAVWIGVSGAGVETRTFDADAWIRIARALAPASSRFIVAGQPSDRPLAEAIVAGLGNATLFNGGFAALCENVARAECVITIDGGFAHIAAAVGVPVHAVFTAGVAAKWKPFSQGSVAYEGDIDLPCRPCTRWGAVPPCPHALACMPPVAAARLRPVKVADEA